MMKTLRLNLRLVEPSQIGTDKLDLTYFFGNLGNRSVLIEQVGIINFSRNARNIYNLSPDINVCATPNLTGQMFMHSLIPPPYRDKPLNIADGSILKIYRPAKIYIDGSEAVFPSVAIEAGNVKSIATSFNTDQVDWDRYNTAVICPFVRFFGSKGQPITSICKGWITTHYPASMYGAVLGGPSPSSGQLLPVSETGVCIVR